MVPVYFVIFIGFILITTVIPIFSSFTKLKNINSNKTFNDDNHENADDTPNINNLQDIKDDKSQENSNNKDANQQINFNKSEKTLKYHSVSEDYASDEKILLDKEINLKLDEQQDILKAVLYSEILGKPKSLR